MATAKIQINRAPVLTLWGSVVAERLGHDRDTALTLGQALAGLNAQSKGRRLGILKAPKAEPGKKAKKAGLGEDSRIELCGRSLPAKKTKDGIRGVMKDRLINPKEVANYLSRKFGEQLMAARLAMQDLAKAFDAKELAVEGYRLYEQFRPSVDAGKDGWAQQGTLDLGLLRTLTKR